MRKTKKAAIFLAAAIIFSLMPTFGASAAAFPDVGSSDPYSYAIGLLKELSVVGGDENGKFNPAATITRAEFSKILYVLYKGTPIAPKSASKFPDVGDDAWYNGYVGWASATGIVGGRDTGLFDPNAPVTIAEATKMFVVAMTAKSDLEWPGGFVEEAGRLGLYLGAEKDVLMPGDPAARRLIAQLAVNAIYSGSVLLAGRTPVSVNFSSKAPTRTETKMLTSTFSNNNGINDNSGDYAGVGSKAAGKIALAELGKATYIDTLKSAVNVDYIGTVSIDSLVGLPVNVTYDSAGRVTRVTLLGTAVTCMAGQLTSSGGKYYLGGSEIKVDWNRLAFDAEHNSPRAYARKENITLISNWSGSNRYFNTNTDELVTLVDTNSDGAYDWIWSEIVWNGMKVQSVTGNTIKTADNPVGSYSWTGWPTGGSVFETADIIKPGDYVNIKISAIDTSGTYKANRNGIPLYSYFYVYKAETVTGKLTEITRRSATDLKCKIDGIEYVFSGFISTSASSDGEEGVGSGRYDLTPDKIGKTVTLVLDEMGYAVRVLYDTEVVDRSAEVGYTSYQTAKGTAVAPVVDIQPQIASTYSMALVDNQMRLLSEMGFTRVYFVLCNPGYPMFSSPTIAPARRGAAIGPRVIESVAVLGGNPNKAYADACHKYGMEAIAVIKPYEGGGGMTVPEGVSVSASNYTEATVGGNRVYFDSFIAKNPEKRVIRKSDGATVVDTGKPITAIEMAFMLDSYSTQSSSAGVRFFSTVSSGQVRQADFEVWISRDNASYELYNGSYITTFSDRSIRIKSPAGYDLFDKDSRCTVLRISGLDIPGDYKYVAVTFANATNLRTIPYTMISIYSGSEELSNTASRYVRMPRPATDTPENHEWGIEYAPVSATDLKGIIVNSNKNVTAVPWTATSELGAENFFNWGFEFNWHGQGHWGDGWCTAAVYGIARGKVEYLSGSLCEAYPEVRDFWLDFVEDALADGFNGIDIRLQSHSSMVTDYMNYGFNQPIVQKYKELYGVDILSAEITTEVYLNIMKIRGDYFTLFLEDASEACKKAGAIFSVHLRDAYIDPKLDEDFNQLGNWTMPKIILDWMRVVDLCDEITMKDYNYTTYKQDFGLAIKKYATERGKKVWVHCYIQQASALNYAFINGVDNDPYAYGMVLYEIGFGGGYNFENLNDIKNAFSFFGCRVVPLK